MTDRPKGQTVLVGPVTFILRVLKPSGAPIVDVKIVVEWQEIQNPYEESPRLQTFVTDKQGRATIPVLDPKDWWIDPNGGTLGKISVTKDFHGPVVPYGTDFKYGPAHVELRARPQGEPEAQGDSKAQPQPPLVLTQKSVTTQVRWGRARVLWEPPPKASSDPASKPAILEVVLVEGGELGKEHAGVPARRLSASNRPDVPPTPVSQLDEELIYHLAHGGFAPTPDTDFKFKVVPAPLGTDQPATLELDLPPSSTTSVPRISVRNGVAGGLRFIHLYAFVGKDKVLVDSEGRMTQLNSRLALGCIRLARALVAASPDVRLVFTSGFNREGKDAYHGNGRAIDLSGVSKEELPGLGDPEYVKHVDFFDPNCVKKTGDAWKIATLSNGDKVKAHERACAAERDFIVLYHWGSVKLLVETASGRSRQKETGGDYRDVFRPATSAMDRLLYRLSDIPAEADRHPNHILTDRHYEIGRDLFGLTYRFFAQEFSHRDVFLGPLAKRDDIEEARGQGVDDDRGAAPVIPGASGGYVLHPDYPAPDAKAIPETTDSQGKDVPGKKGKPKRQRHADHLHANLGRGPVD